MPQVQLSEPVWLESGESDVAGYKIHSVQLSAGDDNSLLLSFDVEGLYRDGGEQVTARLAELVMDWFVVHQAIHPKSPEIFDNQLPPKSDTRAVRAVIWGVSATVEPVERVEFPSTQVRRLRGFLDPAAANEQAMYAMFRIARGQNSPVSRFVILYSILLWITRDGTTGTERQASVDELIWSLDPTEPRVKQASRQSDGTRFTKIRNDIAHPRREQRADVLRIEQDVGRCVLALENLVRKAIIIAAEGSS